VINNLSLLATQRVSLFAIDLPAGLVVASITFVSGGTALATGSHQYFGLYDSSRNLLRASNDDTSTAWGATTAKTLSLTSSFTTTYSGLHYVGILIEASTMPTLHGVAPTAVSLIGSVLTPILTGTSSTGQTSLPNPAAAITVAAGMPYFTVNV
jgi:hypothetical protein